MATRIPINKETGSLGFEDRQKRIWEEMETDMERRRREWEEEIEKMRKEFFMLRPEGEAGLRGGVAGGGVLPGLGLGPRSRLLDASADESRGMVVKDDKGNPVFKVLFDVRDYRPEEVSVKMDAHKIMVSARHEAKQSGSSVSREYSREVRIPQELDPMTLQCTMGPDGVLAVEAPIPAPSYAAVRDQTLPVRTGSPASASGGGITGLAAVAPLQQSASSSTSSSSSYHAAYQPPPRAAVTSAPLPEPSLPAGFKPVPVPFQSAAPPASALGPSSVSGAASNSLNQHPQPKLSSVSTTSSQQTSYSSRADSSSPLLSQGFGAASAKPNPPQFQSSAGQQAAPGFSPPSYSPPVRAGGGGVVGGAQGPLISGVGASSVSTAGRIGSPVVASDSPGQFKLEIDIEDFKPEELTVKTQDRRVVVCAKREEVSGTRASTRELSREHTIPDSVDPLTIKAFFTDGGKLIIEAPYMAGR